MTDGGDGFGPVMSRLLGAKVQTTTTIDAVHRHCRAKWWWEPKSGTAVIESATAIGLAMLPPGKFHPYELDTTGLGALIRSAAAKGATACLIGIGGSATNDGGFGLARALGWQFLNREGYSIEHWTDLDRLARIEAPRHRRWFRKLWIAVDVQNPLLGRRGATRVYGPQKGLREFAHAERCLSRLARVARARFGSDFGRMPGAGAAGGLGFGFSAFLGAELRPGFALFARLAGLDARLRSADLAITGEGAIDRSTLMGKGVGQLAHRCSQLKIPCLALAGRISQLKPCAFSQAHALTELTTTSAAQANPAFWLQRLAARVALNWGRAF